MYNNKEAVKIIFKYILEEEQRKFRDYTLQIATYNDSTCCEKSAEIITGITFRLLFPHKKVLKSDLLCSFSNPHVNMQELKFSLLPMPSLH